MTTEIIINTSSNKILMDIDVTTRANVIAINIRAVNITTTLKRTLS